jgi:hypothetical protein
MLVSELLTNFKAESGYVVNSMILKSSDSIGATYKWLIEYKTGLAVRKEIFIATESGDVVEDRVVIKYVDIAPAE